MVSLDVGCGAVAGTTQHGQIKIDVKKPSLKLGNFIQADAHHLPFKNNSFDIAYFFEVIEHVDSPVKCLREIHNVLKSSGMIYLSTPNPLHYRNCLMALRGGRVHDDSIEHINTWLPGNMEAILVKANFKNVSVSFAKITHGTHHTFIDKVMQRLLPPTVGGYSLLVMAQKGERKI